MEINESKNTFKIKYELNLYWIDEEVTFINLNEVKDTLLNEKQIEALWTPDLVFTNTVNRIKSDYKATSNALVIRKETAASEFAPLSETQNSKSYTGHFG